jgi:hypothetical protein
LKGNEGKSLPTENWHIYKKKHDFETSQFLSNASPKYLDWEVITIFYSAMHLIDSAICKIRLTGTVIPEPKNHKERRKLVARHLACVATEYGMLENISQWARYEEVVIDNNILDSANTLYSEILTYLSIPLP